MRRVLWALVAGWLALAAVARAGDPGGAQRAGSTAEALKARAAAVVAEADVEYQTRLDLPCSRTTWEALVERPSLVGALWTAYGYAPAYKVSEQGEVIHVVDPTGLVGDVHRVAAEGDRYRYLADGRVDHWAVPFLNEGTAVFALELEPGEKPVRGTLQVHVKAESVLAGFLLSLGEPLLRGHVANRMDLNLDDARALFGAVEDTPDKVRRRVGPQVASELAAALSGMADER